MSDESSGLSRSPRLGASSSAVLKDPLGVRSCLDIDVERTPILRHLLSFQNEEAVPARLRRESSPSSSMEWKEKPGAGGTDVSVSARDGSLVLLDRTLVVGLVGCSVGEVMFRSCLRTSGARFIVGDAGIRVVFTGEGDRTLPAGVVVVVGVAAIETGRPRFPSTP
ncbi:hypothetical protein RRF57_011665 [Xylaria bambusicola]|uniref:Uncharacterized protein n=1 Tax=Xylaria bambusicola TaxID=326684 RepID=A0AAN7UVA2_9PEZI